MKSKPKVVLDTNIFINGWFFFDKFCIKILNMFKNKEIRFLFAQDIIGELVYVTKNFSRHYINDEKERILTLERIVKIFYYSTSINTKDTNSPAIKGEADYLISNDFNSGMHDINEFKFKVVSAEDFCKLFE